MCERGRHCLETLGYESDPRHGQSGPLHLPGVVSPAPPSFPGHRALAGAFLGPTCALGCLQPPLPPYSRHAPDRRTGHLAQPIAVLSSGHLQASLTGPHAPFPYLNPPLSCTATLARAPPELQNLLWLLLTPAALPSGREEKQPEGWSLRTIEAAHI